MSQAGLVEELGRTQPSERLCLNSHGIDLLHQAGDQYTATIEQLHSNHRDHLHISNNSHVMGPSMFRDDKVLNFGQWLNALRQVAIFDS